MNARLVTFSMLAGLAKTVLLTVTNAWINKLVFNARPIMASKITSALSVLENSITWKAQNHAKSVQIRIAFSVKMVFAKSAIKWSSSQVNVKSASMGLISMMLAGLACPLLLSAW